MALSATEIARLRGELRVELNGRTVIQAACYAFESKPSEILAGESHIGSNSEEKFSGEILKVERLPIPRTIPLWSDRHAHLSVRFPIGRNGDSEPIPIRIQRRSSPTRSSRWSPFPAQGRHPCGQTSTLTGA